MRGSGLLVSADITIKSISTAGPKDKLVIQESIVRPRSNRGVHTFYGSKTGKDKKIKIRNSFGFTIMFSSDSVKKGKGFSLSVTSFPQGNLQNNVLVEFVKFVLTYQYGYFNYLLFSFHLSQSKSSDKWNGRFPKFW